MTNFPPGIRVIECPWMTVAGPPVDVRYTWWQRLTSWPWRPWRAGYTYTPQIPDPCVYRFSDKISGHPATIRKLVKELDVISRRQEWKDAL